MNACQFIEQGQGREPGEIVYRCLTHKCRAKGKGNPPARCQIGKENETRSAATRNRNDNPRWINQGGTTLYNGGD